MKRVDVVGQVFGRLTAKEMFYEFRNDSKALCRCECGRDVTALVYNLRNGNTASCGCLNTELRAVRAQRLGAVQGKKNTTHGMSKTPTYASWLDARKRCFKPKNHRFAEYGGRGITMCPEWAMSFEAFLRDMGAAPQGSTLERDNVNGNYQPGNCRWASKAEQMRNMRSNVINWSGVREIRRRFQAGESVDSLLATYPMSDSNMQMILSRTTWKE